MVASGMSWQETQERGRSEGAVATSWTGSRESCVYDLSLGRPCWTDMGGGSFPVAEVNGCPQHDVSNSLVWG